MLLQAEPCAMTIIDQSTQSILVTVFRSYPMTILIFVSTAVQRPAEQTRADGGAAYLVSGYQTKGQE